MPFYALILFHTLHRLHSMLRSCNSDCIAFLIRLMFNCNKQTMSSSRPFEEAAECQLRSGSVLHLQSWCGQWPRDAATAVDRHCCWILSFCMILLLDVAIGLLLIDCCDFVWIKMD